MEIIRNYLGKPLAVSGALVGLSSTYVLAENSDYAEPIAAAMELCLEAPDSMTIGEEFVGTSGWRLDPEAPLNAMFSSILISSWDHQEPAETVDYAAMAAMLSLVNSDVEPNHRGFVYEQSFLAILDVNALSDAALRCMISGPAELAPLLTSVLKANGATPKPNEDWFELPLTNRDALLLLNVHAELTTLSRTSPAEYVPQILTDWDMRFRPVNLLIRLAPE